MKAARVNAGLSRVEAARIAGVNTETMRHWENGNPQPKFLTLCGLAHLYGVKPEDITTDKPNDGL